MTITFTCSAIFLKKGKTLGRVHLILILLAFVGATWQLASFAHTLKEFGKQPAVAAVRSVPQIPDGFILPTQLDRTLSIEDARAGDAIEGHIMQEVPLPNQEKIALRSVVKGSVVHVARDEDETGVELTVRFDVVSHRGQNLAVTTSLRAIASYMAVRDQQMAVGAYDEGFPRVSDPVHSGGKLR